jgi:hypothetical protein
VYFSPDTPIVKARGAPVLFRVGKQIPPLRGFAASVGMTERDESRRPLQIKTAQDNLCIS